MNQLSILDQTLNESESPLLSQATSLLKQIYGYSDFYHDQKIILTSVLNGNHTLAIMPTGAGKSVCFQIPALLLPGITFVFSPLIALMKDQVDALKELGVAATFINSTLKAKELFELKKDISEGKYKLVYIAPERINSIGFQEWVETLNISMIVIDEVHCLSAWGHDFRPSYLQIAPFIKKLAGKPLITAFTATATEEVQDDILDIFQLPDLKLHIAGFDRKNLNFQVYRGEKKLDFVLKYLDLHANQAGIIYASTRKEVDKLYDKLKEKYDTVAKYHAGLSDDERRQAQELFNFDKVNILIATNAFGMGIDKSNIRFIIHYNMPRNMESYYQEAGRAGRDNDQGECILLFSPGDTQIQKFMIEQTTLNPIRKVNEYKKLQFMVDFCHSNQCLRYSILTYFGEKSPQSECGNCSFCQLGEWVDITEEAKTVFNCLVQVRQRYGASMIADILKGSRSKKLLQANLDVLATYGALNHYKTNDIKDIIKVLIAQKYLNLTEGEYPILKLEMTVQSVLRDGKSIRYKAMPKQTTQTSVKEDSLLMSQLKEWRYQQAEAHKIPAYLIFSDRTLRQIAEYQPQNQADLLAIQGVSHNKLQRYGDALIEVLKSKPHTGKKLKTKDIKTPSHIETLELFNSGLSIEEVANTRGLSQSTIESHLITCANEELDFDINTLIPAKYETQIIEKIQEIGGQKLKPLKEALPEEISYTAIKAVLIKLDNAN